MHVQLMQPVPEKDPGRLKVTTKRQIRRQYQAIDSVQTKKLLGQSLRPLLLRLILVAAQGEGG